MSDEISSDYQEINGSGLDEIEQRVFDALKKGKISQGADRKTKEIIKKILNATKDLLVMGCSENETRKAQISNAIFLVLSKEVHKEADKDFILREAVELIVEQLVCDY